MRAAALAPVAAKDAANKIGIIGAGNSFGIGNIGIGSSHAMRGAADSVDQASYLRNRMKELLSGEIDETRRSELKSYSMMLDPDLGSLRSVSPAFARITQVERSLARQREQELDGIRRHLSKITGGIL